MARLKSMGRVRRTLVRVRGDGAPPPLPAALWRGDKGGRAALGAPDAGGGGYSGLALVSAPPGPGGPLSRSPDGPPTVEIAPGP
jgi:tRNA-modifying protein YgfZ